MPELIEKLRNIYRYLYAHNLYEMCKYVAEAIHVIRDSAARIESLERKIESLEERLRSAGLDGGPEG